MLKRNLKCIDTFARNVLRMVKLDIESNLSFIVKDQLPGESLLVQIVIVAGYKFKFD